MVTNRDRIGIVKKAPGGAFFVSVTVTVSAVTMPVTAASWASMIVTIAPACAIAALIGFTFIPATVVAVIMSVPAVAAPFIMTAPVVAVTPAAAVPVVTVIITIANL